MFIKEGGRPGEWNIYTKYTDFKKIHKCTIVDSKYMHNITETIKNDFGGSSHTQSSTT